MKQHRFKLMALTTLLSTGMLLGAAGAQANADVDDVLKAGKEKVTSAKASQKRIDKIADETYDLLTDYKTVSKQIENLRIYNEQLDRQIAHQERGIGELEESIANVQDTERQIPPLTIRMIDALEQFIALDMPFSMDERKDRVEKLRNNVSRSDLTSAEKFRQVLEAYTIELGYGQKIETYRDQIEIDGQVQEVNVLRIGRIALTYQTKDKGKTGVWDQDARQWMDLNSGTYRSAISNAIRIAKKQASQDILTLPIKAPEAQ